MGESTLSTEFSRKISDGYRLTRDDAQRLWESCSAFELGALAHQLRLRLNDPKIATYLVDRNINYTNVCNSDCSFCAFYRHDPKHPEAYVLSRETLTTKINEVIALGGTRILLQGGHNDDLPYEYYLDLIEWIHGTFKLDLNAFSPSEIHQMTLVSGKDARTVLTDLKARGLHGLPGGGAEILDDEIRQRVSPKKIGATRWLEIMSHAHDLQLVTTATMVIGFGETIDHRLNHLFRLRDLQDRALQAGNEGFNCFISWTHQFNENTSMGRSRHAPSYGVGAMEYLKNMALARLVLDNVKHHQSSWPTCGPHVAEIGLNFGCDDIGSTMMEENVVSQAGAPTKDQWAMSPRDLRKHIRLAGYTPAQRDSSFALVRTFSEDGPPEGRLAA